MPFNIIEQALLDTFDNKYLEKSEKNDIHELLTTFQDQPDILNFARNKGFEIVRHSLHENSNNSLTPLKWLEQLVKTIDTLRAPFQIPVNSVCFSPGEACVREILKTLNNAQLSIDICVFTISENRLSDAILAARGRGIEVRIITDNDKSNDRGSDVHAMKGAGVNIRMDNSPYHMHHKFAVIDQKVLINGSFNWTRSATEKNQENIVLSSDGDLIQSFSHQFQKLWLTF